MFEKQILVLRKEPFKEAEMDPLFDNTLEAVQKAVGGNFEVLYIASDVVVLCNEEARILEMPFNTSICGVSIYGPLLVVGVKGSDFCSLNPSYLKLLEDMLRR